MEDKNEYKVSEAESEMAALSDAEKEKLYQRAVGYVTSSLTNDELFEESLAILQSLGDYKHAATLYCKYAAQYKARCEERAALSKKRKTSRFWQGVVAAIVFGAILALILILVYALKLDIVR